MSVKPLFEQYFLQQSKIKLMDLFTVKNLTLIPLAMAICFSTFSVSADEVLEEVVDEKVVDVVLEEIVDEEKAGKVTEEVTEEAEPILLEQVFDLDAANESPVTFRSLAQMDELVTLGMPALALRLLDREQKNLPKYSPDWYAFERKHIILLSALDDWQQVIDRVELLLNEALPDQQITLRISRWFSTQQVIARLRLGLSELALSQLRKLLWHSSQSGQAVNDSDIIALWRRLVIRAYLALNSDEDAQTALLRYQHDYSSEHQNLNLDWRLLQARSLLRMQRADEVVDLLADSKSRIAQALRLTAALRARPDHAELYAQEAQNIVNESKLNKGEMWAYRYVTYQAYLVQKKLTEAARVLNELLLHQDSSIALGEEFSVASDDLWKLYETIGLQIGNSSKLLRGDDLAWYNKANELHTNNPVEALSLYVVLAFNASDSAKKQMAHKEVVALLQKDKNGLELINQLYLNGNSVLPLDSLPMEVRYSLIDYALLKSSMKLAVRLMQSVPQPPEGLDGFSWAMRKARVMILEGAHAEGEAVLRNTLSNTEHFTKKQLDHFLQVIFDLQAVARHQQVLALLDSLKAEWLDENIERELFFWKAESYAGLEQFDRAAWSYLKSAQFADRAQAELWAQSARFKAGAALVKAALYDDAQVIYTRLLAVTSSSSRKSAIKQELQQIRLLRNAEKNKSDES